MREFIRHPATIPIDFQVEGKGARDRLKGVGHGGLCFLCREALPTGACLHISIPVEEAGYEADGVVRWCRAAGGQYEVGVEFEQTEEEYRLGWSSRSATSRPTGSRYSPSRGGNWTVRRPRESGSPGMPAISRTEDP